MNMRCFPSTGGVRSLTTKALSEEERASRELDYLGGFEVLDGEFRMFVLEGLSDGSMSRLAEAIPRE